MSESNDTGEWWDYLAEIAIAESAAAGQAVRAASGKSYGIGRGRAPGPAPEPVEAPAGAAETGAMRPTQSIRRSCSLYLVCWSRSATPYNCISYVAGGASGLCSQTCSAFW